MFQIIRNTCSTPGIVDYLNNRAAAAKRGQYLDTVETVTGTSGATDAERIANLESGILPGHLERVCAGLMNQGRALGAEDVFSWEAVGDVRYNMVNWINEPQPSGPLGYGASSVDKETGQIFAGTANLYGAAVDTYARSAADIVRAMNDDLELGSLLSGNTKNGWRVVRFPSATCRWR